MTRYVYRTLQTAALLVLAGLTGCVTVRNEPGRPGNYSDPEEPYVQTLNIDSQDIINAARTAVPDMLAYGRVRAVAAVPRVAVDANEFRNLSFDPLAKQALTGRLRAELQRAAGDRLRIVNPERGRLDGSAGGRDNAAVDYDLCLAGEITSTGPLGPDAQGRRSSSFQILFELYVPGTREIVWSNWYDIKKTGVEPTIYR